MTAKEVPDPVFTENLDNYKGNISFKNVSFAYPLPTDPDNPKEKHFGKNILQNFSMNINNGDRISIMSQSGSCKSTLMKLLLGFYKPSTGLILLDGKDSKMIDPKQIRKNIIYVNQRTLLFQDSIINNMRYGNTQTKEEIINFLLKYNLLSVFNPDPANPYQCLEQQVIKNGNNISMGMQKVIYLVRGVLKNNVSVYIFDEPMTSIDGNTRQNVLKMIDEQTIGKTLIIITHDEEVSQINGIKTVDLSGLINTNVE
jgi:ABC-type multidrug transport system fused ATPase/permease subunit